MATREELDMLKLDNQLCFPLYAAAKGIVKRYTPLLDRLGLTYTQYIAMMVLWEEESVTVSQLGRRLHLDSGTLTPLLKKLEAKGLIVRERDPEDERRVVVSITQRGRDLQEEAVSVPREMASCVELDREEATELRQLLAKVIENVER